MLGLALLLAAGWVLLLPSGLRTVAGFVPGLRWGLTFGLGFGLGTVLTAGLGLGPGKRNLRTPSRGIRINAGALRFGLEYGLGSGVIVGLLFLLTGRFVAALGICLGLGLGSGYLAGLANGLTAAPGDLAAAASPRAVLFRDRRATLLLILAGGLAIGLRSGLQPG